MKLFVWNNPFNVEWGGSCLYVLARNVKEAKRLAVNAPVVKYGAYPDLANTLGEAEAAKLGEPDRVYDVGGEVYVWSE